MLPSRGAILLAVLLAASVLVSGALGHQLFKQKAQVSVMQADFDARLQAAVEGRERAEATLALASQKKAATARKRASAGASLSAASASAPAWASQPLPKEVQDALMSP